MGVGLDILYALGTAASSPYWGWRMLRTGKWRTDWRGRFGRVAPRDDDDPRPTLLIHAVSVGEVNATRQLVQMLRADTDWRIVISVTTNTGFDRAMQLFAAEHPVVRYPLDFTCCVRRFLDAVRPDVVALVELEVWPNFVGACQKRGVPVCVVNGRLSERSYRRYARVKALLRPTFARLAAAAVQTEDYAERFHGLGIPADRVSVTDSMKWDTATIEDAQQVAGADELAKAMGIDRTRPVIVAGSTGPGEEKMLIEAFGKVAGSLRDRGRAGGAAHDSNSNNNNSNSPRRKPGVPDLPGVPNFPGVPEVPGVQTDAAGEPNPRLPPGAIGAQAQAHAQRDAAAPQLILVPRKPERFDEVAALAPGIVRRTRHPDAAARPPDDAHLFLLDTMGELRKAYALADVCIVGRSFGGLFGSDPIDPIALGKPTLIGPRYADFADIVDAFRAFPGGGGIEVTDRPIERAIELLDDPDAAARLAENGRAVIRERQGATRRHAELLTRLMTSRGKES